MKKAKLLIVVLLVSILTGCTANYNVYIDKDLKVNEELTVKIDNDDKISKEDVEAKYIKPYIELINEYKYKYNVKIKNDNVYIVLTKKSNNISSSFKSSLYNILYENYQLINDDNMLTFQNIGACYSDSLFYTGDGSYSEQTKKDNLENLKIIFQFQNKVIETNADEIVDNKYIWNISKENQIKNIKFKINTDEMNDKIKDNKQSNIKNTVIIFSIVIVVLTIITMLFYINHNKKNEL